MYTYHSVFRNEAIIVGCQTMLRIVIVCFFTGTIYKQDDSMGVLCSEIERKLVNGGL